MLVKIIKREREREIKKEYLNKVVKKNRTIDVRWIVKWVIIIYKVVFWVVKSKKI